MNKVNMEQRFSGQLLDSDGVPIHSRMDEIEPKGEFFGGILSDKDGVILKTVPVFFNGITVVGKNHALNEVFAHAGYTPVPVDPWYMGLINNSPLPTLDEGDLLPTHGGWVEFLDYDSGDRRPWVPAAAVDKVKGTTTVSTFTFDGSGVIYGVLICSVETTTAGILWCTGALDTPITVVATNTFKLGYILRY